MSHALLEDLAAVFSRLRYLSQPELLYRREGQQVVGGSVPPEWEAKATSRAVAAAVVKAEPHHG